MPGASSGPARLPGSASLFEQLDKLILVCLRDGRQFRGYLRSFDQYANLVLDSTVERLIIDRSYCDVSIGILAVRGENVMLLGEIDAVRDTAATDKLRLEKESVVRKHIAARKEAKLTLGLKAKFEWPIPEDFL